MYVYDGVCIIDQAVGARIPMVGVMLYLRSTAPPKRAFLEVSIGSRLMDGGCRELPVFSPILFRMLSERWLLMRCRRHTWGHCSGHRALPLFVFVE